MRFVSWNVNGLRACLQKEFLTSFAALDADCFCLQETKLQAGQLELELPGYHQYWNYAEKKGYSGTAVFTKTEPLSVTYGVGVPELDTEGRLITLEFEPFYLVTCYTPNAQDGLKRIDHRMAWDDAFRSYLPGPNRGNAGFSDEERTKFTELLAAGFTDTFRHLHPDATGAYSWWSYRFNARKNNAGWRIDYFLVSNRMADAVTDAAIHSNIFGSDHCPVSITCKEDTL